MSAASNTRTSAPIKEFSLAVAPDQQLGFGAALLMLALAAAALIIFLINGLETRSRVFFGAMLTPNLVVDGSVPISRDLWPGLNAGLRQGDVIVAVNGQPLVENNDYAAGRQRFLSILTSLKPRDIVVIQFDRTMRDKADPARFSRICRAPEANASVMRCQVGYEVNTLPNNDFAAFFIIPYTMGLVAVIIGGVVLLLRPNQLAARLIAMLCAALGVFMAGSYDISNAYSVPPLWLAALHSIGPLTAMLALVFPIKMTALYRQPALLYLPAVVGALILAVALYVYFVPPAPQSFPYTWQSGVLTSTLAVIWLAVTLWRRRRMAASPTIRDQSNTILIGVSLTGIVIALWLLNTLVQRLTGDVLLTFNWNAIMPFFIITPVTLAYAVLQYRVMDTDRIISQSITYGLMLVALITGYFLLVFGGSLITREAFQLRANDPLLIAATIFIMALAFVPVRGYLQKRIDRLYFRVRENYQQRAETFSRALTSLGNIDQIIAAYQHELEETLKPASVFLFLPDRQSGEFIAASNPRTPTDVRFAPDSALVALLNDTPEDLIYLEAGRPWPVELRAERARLNILKTLVIARLRGRKDLIGFVCLGAPLSGSGVYTYEELRFIEGLNGQIAITIERAQAIESLERRVRELDVLSSVSQAVNFTIDFNDLLELISNQTSKLVGAPHFYIVLRESSADRLYFALFIEDYERYRDRENRRWAMGRDLFSEVIRTGAPLRVRDYAAAMAQRSTPIIYEDPEMRAWMGVPMIVGVNKLGLLAVGSSDPATSFSDDQMRIFSDIGALAATSLEKARLFNETNLRARQLSALNEISRQMTSERHVEKLMQLITSSAVDILNAEAGSLLLVEEQTGDFEFRVAVGGGQELVGKRFPKGKGLVGEVARTGKPEIVNDAANDPRWGGEVAKGAFSTVSVLAVPLIAENKVVGVLEVLNKKDGGTYAKEDVDLLTTFAGQAAIAIDNARLYEMTDLQLRQRVTELQVMEKIDVELNRSLDLQRVADVTMRWAIAQTSATGGVLGLVITGEPPYLQIISKYGYEEDDHPEGAEGNLWPLDRGIVSRVIRTRQADIVTDVRIDRDYIPSLRGAKSQITIPMLSAGEIHALLILEKDTDPPLNLLDMAFVQRLAEHAIIAITNAQFYAEMTRANEWKSEFVSFVAHELKTPMTSMRGYTEALLNGMAGSLNDQQNTFLGTIRANIERMQTLVSDINDVTKLQTKNMRMEFSPVDFRSVVTETLRPLHKQIEDKEQRLIMDLPNDLPLVMADQNRLIQVLTNLISNAHKYTPPAGKITLRAEVLEHDIDSKGRDRGPVLHVSVKDTGIGMTEEDVKRLFTPYFRSDNPLAREQPGTGLGLTITHGIVIGHGGRIWVESELEKGTTFHFTVPVVVESESEPEPQPAK